MFIFLCVYTGTISTEHILCHALKPIRSGLKLAIVPLRYSVLLLRIINFIRSVQKLLPIRE